MGLAVGTSVSNLGYTSGTDTYARLGFPRQSDSKNESRLFSNKENTQPDKAGFGEGTVSVPGVAVKTLGSTREGAAQILETLAETQTRVRERTAELNAETGATQEQTPTTVTLDLRSAGVNAASGARNFINGLSEAAGMALSRTEGTPPPQTEPRFNVRVGDQTVPVTGRNTQPIFDVSV